MTPTKALIDKLCALNRAKVYKKQNKKSPNLDNNHFSTLFIFFIGTY